MKKETRVPREAMTFSRREASMKDEIIALLQQNKFDEMQKVVEKLARLQEIREQLSTEPVKDKDHDQSLLMSDPVYQHVYQEGNIEMVHLFQQRKVSETLYQQLREIIVGQSEKEKRMLVDRILTTLQRIRRLYGEKRSDAIEMRIGEFLDSPESPQSFDTQYLQSILDKVKKYERMLQKIETEEVRRRNEKRLQYKQEREQRQQALQEEAKRAKKLQQEEEQKMQEKYVLLMESYEISQEQLAKLEGLLYKSMSDLCEKTWDTSLSKDREKNYRDSSCMKDYARAVYGLKTMETRFSDGKIPQAPSPEMRNYFQTYGLVGSSEKMQEIEYLLSEIHQTKKILTNKRKALFWTTTEEPRDEYISDSSSIFTGNLIPLPIDRQASHGMTSGMK